MKKSINFSDIVLKHNKSIVDSRSDCDTRCLLGEKEFAVPVCCSNMKSILTKDICKIFDENNWFYVYHRMNGCDDVRVFVGEANGVDFGTFKRDKKKRWNTISISVGVGQEWIDIVNVMSMEKMQIDFFTVDVALSYNDNIIPIIRTIKKLYPESYLIVGNGCSPEWVSWLEKLGVNCAKVGIGVSKSCRTRQYTGFGSSTVTDLMECVNAAKNIDIMSDGGLTVDDDGEVWVGDINKALTVGADFVMSGALFSKCIDSPSVIDGYYGNASASAKNSNRHIEGTNIKVITNGFTVLEMCNFVRESIQSGISYAGGKDLTAFNNVKWDLV